ncbi:DUF2165 family protein [Xenorhabdus hominickii]|uniref:Membrane protein n=1 Tax=Xenorhabdus hominickii TaxID=351679 RepID=A0A2G0Q4E5_XENHO|nr:DUF2165 family protein [Xenorhabdus hominickii]AOM42488.1 hypothetical protein A9255_19210 [Xenorhabdus hominickii]PHM54090.1 membrane protein [Xenorhabdus hominickii]
MDSIAGIDLFKALHAFGIAGWATIGVINNVQSFTVTTGTVGRMMSMAFLKQEPPVNTPLLRRATTSRAMHGAALAFIVVLQAITAIAMWIGGYLLLMTASSYPEALPWLNVGITCFAMCAFVLLLGGLWYGYWIRQEGLQLTHIAIVIWSIAAFLLFHLSMAPELIGDIR